MGQLPSLPEPASGRGGRRIRGRAVRRPSGCLSSRIRERAQSARRWAGRAHDPPCGRRCIPGRRRADARHPQAKRLRAPRRDSRELRAARWAFGSNPTPIAARPERRGAGGLLLDGCAKSPRRFLPRGRAPRARPRAAAHLRARRTAAAGPRCRARRGSDCAAASSQRPRPSSPYGNPPKNV